MSILRREDMPKLELNMPAAKNVVKQTGITGKNGWDGWSMRIFTLGAEGYTPKHTHDWPHINYIISGEGSLLVDGKEQPVNPGDTAYVKGGEEHQFKNTGAGEFSFICIVPEEGDK